MMNRLEDFAGKAFLVAIFTAFTTRDVLTIAAMAQNPWSVDYWALVLTSRVFALAFLVLMVCLTVVRLPPKDSAAGLEPRISAFGGTFILMLLIVLPTGSVGPGMRILSTMLIVIGTVLSIYCLYWLGRSFSIMATARKLVTSGPYATVRHPLYLAEAMFVTGIVISNWSIAAVLVGVAQFALQFRRMSNEERVLRRTFPEYCEYANRVPMIIPRMGLARSDYQPDLSG